MDIEQQADKLAEVVQAAGLTPSEAEVLALHLQGITDYVEIAAYLGIPPASVNARRTRLRKKLTIAAANAEEQRQFRATDQADAEKIAGPYGFYSELLSAFSNRRNTSPRTPVFKNVRQDAFTGTLTGEKAALRGELVLPEDLIRARRKAA